MAGHRGHRNGPNLFAAVKTQQYPVGNNGLNGFLDRQVQAPRIFSHQFTKIDAPQWISCINLDLGEPIMVVTGIRTVHDTCVAVLI